VTQAGGQPGLERDYRREREYDDAQAAHEHPTPSPGFPDKNGHG
jgi:hypothetical protein